MVIIKVASSIAAHDLGSILVRFTMEYFVISLVLQAPHITVLIQVETKIFKNRDSHRRPRYLLLEMIEPGRKSPNVKKEYDDYPIHRSGKILNSLKHFFFRICSSCVK